jgi:hypothetical protein
MMKETTEAKQNMIYQPVREVAVEKSQIAVARVPQGYNARVKIRLVPGRDIQFNPKVPSCRPRQGSSSKDAEHITIPDNLAAKLKDADKKVVAWLAQDESNAQLFLKRPIDALIKAGVELSRSELKTLERTHRAVKEARVIAPGVNVVDISTSVDPKGRVGKIKPGLKLSKENFNCEPKRKV